MRNLVRALVLFAVLAGLTFAGRSWSVPPKPEQAPAPRHRVALINLSYVVKNYGKFKNFQEEMKKSLNRYEARDREITRELEEIAKQIAGTELSAEERRDLERKAKTLQREREDNQNDAKQALSKKSDEQAVLL